MGIPYNGKIGSHLTERLFFSWDEVDKTIDSMHPLLKGMRNDLKLFLSMECYPNETGTGVISGRNGRYAGPCQFREDTWNDVKDRVSKLRDYRELFVGVGKQPWSMRNDLKTALTYAAISCLAGLPVFLNEYRKMSKQAYRGKLNGALMYLIHQQGARGAAKAVFNKRIPNKQSAASIRLFERDVFSQA